MIIYNVTIKIETSTHDQWLQWMREVHIPEVLATGHFIDNQIARVLVDDDDGVTYAIQYRCHNLHELEQYQKNHAPRLQADHAERYRDKFVAFRTLLETVD